MHKEKIKELIISHYRRLQILKQQAAIAGQSVDPKILIEIEDIEAAIEGLQAKLKLPERGMNTKEISADPITLNVSGDTITIGDVGAGGAVAAGRGASANVQSKDQ